MEATKQLTLKNLSGEEITFTLCNLISQWHSEQIEAVYLGFMTYDEEKKEGHIDTSKANYKDITFARINKLVEVMVQSWSKSDLALSVDNIKKNLNSVEYDKLIAEIEEIYSSQTLSTEKKSLLPNDSSQV